MTDSQILKNILEALINRGDVLNLNDLANRLPHDYGSLNKIINDKPKSKLTPGLRQKLNERFGVSLNYMRNSSEDMFNSITGDNNPEVDPWETPAAMKKRIEKYEEQIKLMQEYIDVYKALFKKSLSEGYVFVSEKEMAKPK